jgi:hypothetical protein
VRRAAIVLLCLLGMVEPSQAGSLERYVGLSYKAARAKLIHAGYRAVPLKHRSSDMYCQHDNFCRVYPEAIECSDIGEAPCRFALRERKSGKYIIVTTYGEYPRVTYIGAPEYYDVEAIKERR